jgi:glucose-1-phosphate thymidylyltransferase
VLTAPANKGEYYLTDAFQWMIENGRRILAAEVGGWYDCGKLDTLLETNEILLRKGAATSREYPGVTIRQPVLIEEGVTIERSTIGPNVTIEKGSILHDCELSHTIMGRDCNLAGARLTRSMIGNSVVIRDIRGSVSLGDHSEIVGNG